METQQEFDIKKYSKLLYQKRYVFVAVVVIVSSIAIAVSYFLPKTYEAKSTVLIERNYVNELMKGIAVPPSMEERVKALEVILKSRYLIRKVIGDLDLDLTRKTDIEVEKLVQAFQKAMDIKIEMNRSSRSDMDMFTVSFRNGNPALARDYVNVLVRKYIEESLSHNRDETYGANKFLLEQINLFKDKISSIEADIARISRQPGTAAQERLRVLQKRLDELRLQYTDNHPDIMKVKAEMESLRSQLTDRKPSGVAGRTAERQQTGLNTVEDRANKNDAGQDIGASGSGDLLNRDTETTQKQGAEASSSKLNNNQKITALERDRDTYRKIYEDLMAALGRSEVSNQIEVQDKGGAFKIVEPAVLPVNPVGPNRVKIILLGLFAGIGGGIAFIILLDSMDKSVKTMDTLKGFGLPVLAVIPHIENTAEIQKTKKKDLLLYVITGVYYAFVIGLISFEFLKRGAL